MLTNVAICPAPTREADGPWVGDQDKADEGRTDTDLPVADEQHDKAGATRRTPSKEVCEQLAGGAVQVNDVADVPALLPRHEVGVSGSEEDPLHERALGRGLGQAVGVVMERYQIPEQQAFAILTRLSQNRNVKLRQIADEILRAVTDT